MAYQNYSLPELNKKFQGLDHLRAWAITIVFLFHYRLFPHPDWINCFENYGWTGVDLFFVLSGYLIAGQLFRNMELRKSLLLKEFYIKRIFRILPAYLAILALYFTIPAFKERDGLSPLWQYLTFTQNLGLDRTRINAFTHAWSLCIEEQFYLCLPVILLLALRLKALRWAAGLLPLLFIAGLLVRIFIWLNAIGPLQAQGAANAGAMWYQYIYYPTYCRLDGLLTGVSIAALLQYKPVIKNIVLQHGNKMFGIGLALIIAAYFICTTPQSFSATVWGFPLVAVAYGFMVIAAVSPGNILARFSSKITASIATLSYSLYLSHKAIIHLTQAFFAQYGIKDNNTAMVLICAATALFAAVLLHYVVEKPFLKLRDVILRRETQ